MPDEAATLQFAAALAGAMRAKLNIYLHGDLGAGKTTLVRGLLHALGHVGKVKSPTYSLMEAYEVNANNHFKFNLYHFDLYRFNDDEEWESAGFRDYFNAENVCVIEWPEKAQNLLPRPDLDITFDIKMLGGSLGRRITVTAHTILGKQCLQAISIEK